MEKAVNLHQPMMTTDSATGHSTTTYESWDFDKLMAKVKAEREKFVAEEMPRLIEKYGNMSVKDAQDVANAEKCIAECEKCEGLPCGRSSIKECTPQICVTKKFGVEIRYGVCRFVLAENRKKNLDRKSMIV